LKANPGALGITGKFTFIKNADIQHFDLDNLYRQAAAEIHVCEDIVHDNLMMFGGMSPAYDMAAPSEVLSQYEVWIERLYRAERGLPILEKKVEHKEEPSDREAKDKLILLIEDFARLREAGYITEDEYQEKKKDILNRL
jgi:hypothetical protein